MSSELQGAPSIPTNGTTQQVQPAPIGTFAQQYPTLQQNGTSPTSIPQQPQQPISQYPPGVKPRPSEIPPPGIISTPQQQAQGTRPTSAAAQQMLPQQSRPSAASGFPGSLSDLVLSFENVKQKGQLSSNSHPKSTKLLTYCLPLAMGACSQRHIACPTLTKSTSFWKAVTRVCLSLRTPRSMWRLRY